MTDRNCCMFQHQGAIGRELLQQRDTSQPANFCFVNYILILAGWLLHLPCIGSLRMAPQCRNI